MKIGVIGCGHIGSAIARNWVQAGHDVILSARHQENAERLAKKLGKSAQVGTPEEAARLGEVVLLTIPLLDVPKLSEEVKDALKGKIVLDTCNPYYERDGKSADEVFNSGQGTGVWTAKQIPGARIVRAFNSVHAETFETQSRRQGDPVGVPLASDDQEALSVAAKLVRDAGFGPVVVGNLEEAKRFDNGTPTYGSGASDKELRKRLGLEGHQAA
jgi:predicted dinucleotide-binding enzyme